MNTCNKDQVDTYFAIIKLLKDDITSLSKILNGNNIVAIGIRINM